MKKLLVNEYYALLYQFLIVPLLAGCSLLFYYHFVMLRAGELSSIIGILVTVVLVALNIVIIYGITRLNNNVFKMPLVNHVITGLFTIVVLGILSFYFYHTTNMSCAEVSAIKCGEDMVTTRYMITALIVAVTYYFLFIVLQIMVNKQNEPKK